MQVINMQDSLFGGAKCKMNAPASAPRRNPLIITAQKSLPSPHLCSCSILQASAETTQHCKSADAPLM